MYEKIHRNKNDYIYKECVFISEFHFTKPSLLFFLKYNFVGSLHYFQIIWLHQFEIILPDQNSS